VVHCAVVDFPNPRFPSAKPAASTSSSRPPAAAPKQPVAKMPAVKSTAAKAPAASKASAAKSSVAKPVPKVQVVDTVSDDNSEEDDMPSLVTSDESDQEQSHERHGKRTPPASRDPSEGRASLTAAAKGKQVPLDASAKGKAVPSASSVKDKPMPSAGTGLLISKGKPAPSAVPTESKQSSVIAYGEPIFKPVSRGYLAQQSAKWALSKGQPTSAGRKTSGNALPKAASSSSEQKQTASGTDFSFDRAISGGSKDTLKQAQPNAAASQMLGRHADSFAHYEYDSSGVTSEEEVSLDPDLLVCTV